MSATMTAPEQIDGLEKLITLASLRKEDIIATQEEARRQLQLTQAEQERMAEAKAFIAQHASLAADLQRREDDLAIGKSTHEKTVAAFSEHMASENARLESFAAILAGREKTLAEAEKRLTEESAGLTAAKADHTRQHNEALGTIQQGQAANAETGKALVIEAQRLKDWEETLKAKAQRLRDQAANF